MDSPFYAGMRLTKFAGVKIQAGEINFHLPFLMLVINVYLKRGPKRTLRSQTNHERQDVLIHVDS